MTREPSNNLNIYLGILEKLADPENKKASLPIADLSAYFYDFDDATPEQTYARIVRFIDPPQRITHFNSPVDRDWDAIQHSLATALEICTDEELDWIRKQYYGYPINETVNGRGFFKEIHKIVADAISHRKDKIMLANAVDFEKYPPKRTLRMHYNNFRMYLLLASWRRPLLVLFALFFTNLWGLYDVPFLHRILRLVGIFAIVAILDYVYVRSETKYKMNDIIMLTELISIERNLKPGARGRIVGVYKKAGIPYSFDVEFFDDPLREYENYGFFSSNMEERVRLVKHLSPEEKKEQQSS